MTIRYAPGNDFLVVAEESFVLLPAATDDAIVTRLWAAMQSGADLVTLVDIMSSAGLRGIPDAVVASVLAAGGIRVALRGSALVLADGRSWDASGHALWSEHVVAGSEFVASLGRTGGAPALPVTGGVVLASAMQWAAGADPQAPPVVPASQAEGRDEPVALSISPVHTTSVDPGADLDRGPAAEPHVVESPAAEVQPASAATAEDTFLELPERTEPDADDQDEPDGRHAGLEASAAAAISAPGQDDSYDRLFGATEHINRRPLHREPEPTGVVPESTPAREEQPAPVAGQEAGSLGAGAVEQADPAPDASPRPEAWKVAGPASGLISSVPVAGAAASPAAPALSTAPAVSPAPAFEAPGTPSAARPVTAPVPSPLGGDEPSIDQTIARPPSRPSRESGPQVHAVLCPQGHPNPPEAVTCRLCRVEVPAQAATTMPRPVLGALVLSSATPGAPREIPLDGPSILGRRPAVDKVMDVVPRLVTVPSPDQDLSRSHVKVTLEGWHVLVTDLDSVNGTSITLPDGEPQRLRPEQPAMILPGTVVTLAETVTYVFEVRP
ncbi:MAG: FHA domain-containing protein [Candidatus Nanopelagicales bacterium]|jgi:hypothetical protein